MAIRHAAVSIAASIALSGCGGPAEGDPAETATTEPTTPTETIASVPLSTSGLVAKWQPLLSRALTAPCRPEPFGLDCLTAVIKLGQLADELTDDAAAAGFASLELVAREHAAAAHRWANVCVVSLPGTAERSECVGSVYTAITLGEESLLAAVYETRQF